MSIIGIDFGSNAIVIGTALGMSGGTGRGGIDVILNGNSQRRTPNIVSFVDKERFMGEQAEPYVRSKVNNTITSLNRILGHNYSEPIIQNELARLAYKVVKSDGDKISIEVQYNGETRSFTPEQITAMILSHCCELAQKAQNNYSKPDVVVAVPSYWTDSQRRAIKNACDIADVSCLGIVNSSTATCIDYGIFRNLKGQFAADKPTNVMFYDMGYSDTVCSIVSYYNGKFVVQAVAYDVNLGGRDVDDLIVNKIADEFTTKYHIDPRKNKKSMVKIQTAAEKAKKTLSPQGVDRTPISIECVCEDRDYNGILYLKDFEALLTAANLPQRCQNVIQDALVQCGFTPKDIEIVEICGGGIRVPLLKRTVAEYMQRNLEAQNFGLNTTLNMDETVGRGSAIKCAMLSPRIRIKDVAIEDKNLFNIGISINGTQSILFPRYCSYPAEKVLSLPGYNNYEIEIGYTENNRLPPEADRHICKILIQADDHMKEENAAITLSISLDQEGCIRYNTTQITIPQPDIQVEKIVKKPAPAPTEGEKKEEAPAMIEEKVMETQHVPPKVYIPMVQVTYNTMDTGVIDNCKKCEVDMKAFDKALRETKHAKNELESFIYNMRDKFYGTYNDYILEEEKNKIMAAMEEEENWIYSYEGETATKDTYEARLKTLQEMTHDVIFRYTEAEGRKDLINRLNTVITYCNTLLASTEEKYAHITKEERDPLLKEVAELKEWFDATYNKQLTLNKYENPVLLCNDMKIKGNAIYEKVYKAMSKPKPVEKPTTPKDKDVDMEKKEEPQKEEPQKEEPQKEEPQKEEDVDMEKKDEDVKME